MARLLALFAVLGALALAGCGGGGDSDSESTTAGSEATVGQAPQASAGQEPGASGQDDGDSAASGQDGGSAKAAPPAESEGTGNSSSTHTHPPLGDAVAGTKSPAPGVPVTPQGDNSIQTFGQEGDETEREQATAELEAYLNARARGDWAGACAAASAQFSEELEKLIEGAKAKPGAEKPEGCAATLELLYGKAPASAFQKAAQIDRVLSFRTRDDGYAYLIYESQGEIKFVAMADDSGAWKVNVPEPASFEGPSQGESQ